MRAAAARAAVRLGEEGGAAAGRRPCPVRARFFGALFGKAKVEVLLLSEKGLGKVKFYTKPKRNTASVQISNKIHVVGSRVS